MAITPHGLPTGAEGTFHHIGHFTDEDAAHHTDAALKKLAELMMLQRDPADPKDGPDGEENIFVPAGYTYLGQFVDHDLTFDTISNFSKPASFARAADMRTPRFDLDNVYGRGPDDQPYLYDDDGRILLGDDLQNGVRDVMRNMAGRAIIGDPRNDENSIVVQIQSAFIRFHNNMLERALHGQGTAKLAGPDAFEWAHTQVRHHYQRMLLDDYLPRIVDADSPSVKPIFEAVRNGRQPKLRLFDLDRGPYMPLEFSAAAYRFGHSMIRPGYRLATEPGNGKTKLFSIFQGPAGGLRGFQKLAPEKGIEWRLFFDANLPAGQGLTPTMASDNNAKGTSRTQFAYKIDTMLVDPIGHLPPAVAANPSNLAERNLKRARDFKLPSGQAVARALGLDPLLDTKLSVRLKDDFTKRQALADIAPEFANSAPLWFYILAEAEQAVIAAFNANPMIDPQQLGTRLTGVGAAIVVETFVGLMLVDEESVLRSHDGRFTSINGVSSFSMRELLGDIGAL